MMTTMIKTNIWVHQAFGEAGLFIYPDLETCLVYITLQSIHISTPLHSTSTQITRTHALLNFFKSSNAQHRKQTTIKLPGGNLVFREVIGGKGRKAGQHLPTFWKVSFTLPPSPLIKYKQNICIGKYSYV